MNHEQCIKCAKDIDERFLNVMVNGFERSDDGRGNRHLRWMVQELSKPEFSENKAMRWLGYIQGALVVQGFASLDQMKEASRRAVHGHEEQSR